MLLLYDAWEFSLSKIGKYNRSCVSTKHTFVLNDDSIFKNEYKFLHEAVLVQQYLCTPVNFPLHLRVPFFVHLLTVLLLRTLQNLA